MSAITKNALEENLSQQLSSGRSRKKESSTHTSKAFVVCNPPSGEEGGNENAYPHAGKLTGDQTKRKPSKKDMIALLKTYNDFLKIAKKYELDADIRHAKEYFEKALAMVPQFKKSKQNDRNAEKLRKKVKTYATMIIKENIDMKVSGFGSVHRPVAIDVSDEDIPAPLSTKDGAESSQALEWNVVGDTAKLVDGFNISKPLYDRMYDHQKIGVAWLWKLYIQCHGGVLADDMGLGKTMQVITFASGLLRQRNNRRILIVAPASLLPHWRNEIKRFDPTIPVGIFGSQSKNVRNKEMKKIVNNGGVLVTNYEKVWFGERSNNVDLFTASTQAACDTLGWPRPDKCLQWAAVVLDEGHRIKNNKTGIYGALTKISARMKLVLSGTPVQNNLDELWSIFSFISDGTIFPSLHMFRKHIAYPIQEGEMIDSTAEQRQEARYKRKQLHLKIKDYILRREKGKTIPTTDKLAKEGSVVRKHDMVVWVPLSSTQRKLYHEVLESSRVSDILRAVENESSVSGTNVLLAMNDLKQVCDGSKNSSTLSAKASLDLSVPHEENCKLVFLGKLVGYFKQEGHRALIFSKFTKCLDEIELMCVKLGYEAGRIDGSVKHEDRQNIVDSFNHSANLDVMLLTTGVGAVGLTLTGADRVVIFGPDWNPAIDNQAVDRAFRIGQSRDVLCYRLMTCNTIEEIMYRRQVFKQGLVRTVLQNKEMNVYSNESDLAELFEFVDPDISQMQEQLAAEQQEINQIFVQTYSALVPELEAVEKMDIFGLSHHDVLFDEERKTEEEAGVVDSLSEEQLAAQTERRKASASLGLQHSVTKQPQEEANQLKAQVRRKTKQNKKTAKKAMDIIASFRDELYRTWSDFDNGTLAVKARDASFVAFEEAMQMFPSNSREAVAQYCEWAKQHQTEAEMVNDHVKHLKSQGAVEALTKMLWQLNSLEEENNDGYITNLLTQPHINWKSSLVNFGEDAYEGGDAYETVVTFIQFQNRDFYDYALPVPKLFPAIDDLILQLSNLSRGLNTINPTYQRKPTSKVIDKYDLSVKVFSKFAGVTLKMDESRRGVYLQGFKEGPDFDREISADFDLCNNAYRLVKVGRKTVTNKTLDYVCKIMSPGRTMRPLTLYFQKKRVIKQVQTITYNDDSESEDECDYESNDMFDTEAMEVTNYGREETEEGSEPEDIERLAQMKPLISNDDYDKWSRKDENLRKKIVFLIDTDEDSNSMDEKVVEETEKEESKNDKLDTTNESMEDDPFLNGISAIHRADGKEPYSEDNSCTAPSNVSMVASTRENAEEHSEDSCNGDSSVDSGYDTANEQKPSCINLYNAFSQLEIKSDDSVSIVSPSGSNQKNSPLSVCLPKQTKQSKFVFDDEDDEDDDDAASTFRRGGSSPIPNELTSTVKKGDFDDDDDDDDDDENTMSPAITRSYISIGRGSSFKTQQHRDFDYDDDDDDDEDQDFLNLMANRGNVDIVANVKERFKAFLSDEEEDDVTKVVPEENSTPAPKTSSKNYLSTVKKSKMLVEEDDYLNESINSEVLSQKHIKIFDDEDDDDDEGEHFNEHPICVTDEDDSDDDVAFLKTVPAMLNLTVGETRNVKHLAVISDSDDEETSLIDRLRRKDLSVPSKSETAKRDKLIRKMTPSQWRKQRSTHAQRLYEEYNGSVFYNKLPKSMAIQWSSRLAKTAGLTYTFFDYDEENTRMPGAKIELSTKVLTDLTRLRSTLLHEMCHAASWIIDHARKPPHGPVFQKWASRASEKYPCDAVTTCHSYKIHYKFRWKCSDDTCHWECGRHSQSVSVVKHRCGRCGAKIIFLGKFDANGDPMKERAPSAYSAFKQKMMESVQREHPHLDFGGIQRELARMWKVQKEK